MDLQVLQMSTHNQWDNALQSCIQELGFTLEWFDLFGIFSTDSQQPC